MIKVTIDGVRAVQGAQAALDEIGRRMTVAIVKGSNEGAHFAALLATGRYMSSGGGAPNPAPGPLKKRSGALAKAVRPVPAKVEGQAVVTGLHLVGSNKVKTYGYTHEFGGTHSYVIRPRKPGGLLVFQGRDGSTVFAREVHRQPLPPRPYMGPALEDAEPFFVRRIDYHLDVLAKTTLSRYLR